MNHYICIIAALKNEISEIKRKMEVHETISAGAGRAYCGIWHHHQIILVRSGIGREMAKKALEEVCGQFVISEVISIGFAGGLEPDLKTGDLVLADSVIEINSKTEKLESADLFPIKSHLLERTFKLKLPEKINVKRGRLVTVKHPACTLAEKSHLYKNFSAIAVDMETSALLKLSSTYKIPFLSIRVISDSADQELVNFVKFVDKNGEVSKLKVGWHIFTNLGLLPKVDLLRQATQSAAKNLTRYLEELLVFARQVTLYLSMGNFW